MSASITKIKVAWIRDASAPVGRPAPGRLNCKCGNAPATWFQASQGNIKCACGRVYSWNGWLIDDPTLAEPKYQSVEQPGLWYWAEPNKIPGSTVESWGVVSQAKGGPPTEAFDDWLSSFEDADEIAQKLARGEDVS